jgi:hypothetical protein
MTKKNGEDKMSTDDMIDKVNSFRKINPLKIKENQPLSKNLYIFLNGYPIRKFLHTLESLIHSQKGISFDKTTKKEHYRIFIGDSETVHILVIKLDDIIKINIHLDFEEHGTFLYNEKTSSFLYDIRKFFTESGFKTSLIRVKEPENRGKKEKESQIEINPQSDKFEKEKPLRDLAHDIFFRYLDVLFSIFKKSVGNLIGEYNSSLISRYIKNVEYSNRDKPVVYKNWNMNTSEVRLLICEILRDEGLWILNDTTYLFQLIKVGRLHLNFLNFSLLVCKLAKLNSGINHNFKSARMFKNIILERRAGKNFKISDPIEFRFKLRLFNKFSGLKKKIDYMDILNVSCSDYIGHRMTKKQFLTIAFMIMDAVEKENYKLTQKVNHKIWVSLKRRKEWRLARFFKRYFVQKKEIKKVRSGII